MAGNFRLLFSILLTLFIGCGEQNNQSRIDKSPQPRTTIKKKLVPSLNGSCPGGGPLHYINTNLQSWGGGGRISRSMWRNQHVLGTIREPYFDPMGVSKLGHIRYGNNVEFEYSLFMSPAVKNIQVSYTLNSHASDIFTISTERDGDLQLSGWRNLRTTAQIFDPFNSSGAPYLKFRWNSDSTRAISVRGIYEDYFEPFDVSKVIVECEDWQGTDLPIQTITNNRPYDGLLIGDGDIIYFELPYQERTGPEDPGYIVHLDKMDGDEDADFDVFVRAGRASEPLYPDETTHDWSNAKEAYLSGKTKRNRMRSEVVSIPARSVINETDRLYIAVKSMNGKGHFRLRANKLETRRSFTVWHPPEYDGNTAEIEQILKETTSAFYAATEGRYLIDRWYLTSSTSMCAHWNILYCDVYFEDDYDPNGRNGRRYPIGNFIEMYRWKECTERSSTRDIGQTLAHELGHMVFGLDDHYEDCSDCPRKGWATSGHSFMANSNRHDWRASDLTVGFNHSSDPERTNQGIGVDPATGEDHWKIAEATGLVSKPEWLGGNNRTPDPGIYVYYNPVTPAEERERCGELNMELWDDEIDFLHF